MDQASHSHLRWSWGAAGGRSGSPVLGRGLWGRPLRAHTSRRLVCPSAEELRRVEPSLNPHCLLLLPLLLPRWAKGPGCHPPEPPLAQPEPPLELRSPSASAKSTGTKGWGVSQNRTHTHIKDIKHEESFQHKGSWEIQIRASSCWENIVIMEEREMEALECIRVERSHSQGGFNTYSNHIWMGVCTDLFKCWVMFVYVRESVRNAGHLQIIDGLKEQTSNNRQQTINIWLFLSYIL